MAQLVGMSFCAQKGCQFICWSGCMLSCCWAPGQGAHGRQLTDASLCLFLPSSLSKVNGNMSLGEGEKRLLTGNLQIRKTQK